MASALAYTTLFSLVPVMAVSFSFLTAFGSLPGSKESVQDFLFKHFLPSSSEIVYENLVRFSQSATTVGLIGLVFLASAAVFLFKSIEEVFNTIWEIDEQRSIFSQFTTFTSLVFWGPILIGFSLYLTVEIQNLEILKRMLGPSLLHRLFTFLIPIFFTWVIFTAAYQYLPNTQVKLFPAALGGVIAGTLWELAKIGFNIYVARSFTYNKIYGSLGIIPIFLFWLYLSWVIMLLGVTATYVFQNFSRLVRESYSLPSDFPKGYLAVRLLMKIGEQFMKGGTPPSLQDLTQALGYSQAEVTFVVNRLIKGGMVNKIHQNEGYQPARALDQIKIGEIVELFTRDLLLPQNGAQDRLFPRLRDMLERMEKTLEKMGDELTIRDLLTEQEALSQRGELSQNGLRWWENLWTRIRKGGKDYRQSLR